MRRNDEDGRGGPRRRGGFVEGFWLCARSCGPPAMYVGGVALGGVWESGVQQGISYSAGTTVCFVSRGVAYGGVGRGTVGRHRLDRPR